MGELRLSRPLHGGNLAWAAKIAGCPASLILDFSASINPLGPPKSAITAIQGNLESIKTYPNPHYSQLRSSLSEWHQLPSEWILPGNGSAELFTWAGWELAPQSATCLVTPAFSDYERALKAFNANVCRCPLLLEEVEGREAGGAGEVGEELYLTPGLEDSPLPLSPPPLCASAPLPSKGLLLNNPHNPSGKLFPRREILPYLEEFSLVVVDEAFMDFLPPQQQQSLISLVQDYPNLVILRSLTKFYSLPGLRLGYAIAHPDRLQRWQNWRDPWPVNTLAAAAGEAVIKDTDFQKQTRDWLIPARSQLFQGLAALPGLQPLESAANFLLVRTEQPSSQLQEKLLQHNHILIRDCLSFPELGDRYFRVAVRSHTDNQRLLEGFAAII